MITRAHAQFGDRITRAAEADSVAILRDHAPVWLSLGSRFCLPAKLGKQILSIFCVITLLLVISGKWGEADSVARLKMDPKVAQVGPSSAHVGPSSAHTQAFSLTTMNACTGARGKVTDKLGEIK